MCHPSPPPTNGITILWTVKQLVGAETAQRLRLLKADLEGEPLDLAAPDDVDIYDEEATTVATDDADER